MIQGLESEDQLGPEDNVIDDDARHRFCQLEMLQALIKLQMKN